MVDVLKCHGEVKIAYVERIEFLYLYNLDSALRKNRIQISNPTYISRIPSDCMNEWIILFYILCNKFA